MIPIYQPSLKGNEKKYVTKCLDTNWISSKGEFVNLFEKKFASYVGTNYATSVSNGTIALHLAMLTLGIGEGDEVIVPTFTYIASVNAITYVNAKPIFVDSEEEYWQIDTDSIEDKITSKTKAILAVHLYGHPCNMDKLIQICKKYKIFLIEDCAEAIGSKYNGEFVGTFGDISTYSFYGNKTITTGEGGMLITNDQTLHERAVHFKTQGLAKHRQYWHDVIGYNFRMTNICAAIGLAQLENINKILKKKRKIAETYANAFINSNEIEFHNEHPNHYHSYWMCSILLKDNKKRDDLREFLEKKGIETRPTFYPVHTMTMYSKRYKNFSVAEDLGRKGINLPSYPDLSTEEINFIIVTINEFFQK